ncbi:hypothetical protein GLOTRDRAFT_128012 [Gloeophyllum trabeum ATCC 11539]|uniref:Uncharacterized protein n=1 Tax=Gloeophyllum trabeum (strain ATCC 11539 / FP-39264 / Madison 617) TaxID=670483 RepID=S7RSK9_GLOTA|nr:uncharacterized protein GLOTRDRAFT_128012 [Gloeophyllum trabeum ATCC 11539]EPQ57655.1 hypothetical protein GLOTRDRAFT_128012 [Gloeophyllum trabeum ATCC 11539]
MPTTLSPLARMLQLLDTCSQQGRSDVPDAHSYTGAFTLRRRGSGVKICVCLVIQADSPLGNINGQNAVVSSGVPRGCYAGAEGTGEVSSGAGERGDVPPTLSTRGQLLTAVSPRREDRAARTHVRTKPLDHENKLTANDRGDRHRGGVEIPAPRCGARLSDVHGDVEQGLEKMGWDGDPRVGGNMAI